MEPILLATIFISFFCTFFMMPFWIKKAKQIDLVWEDMNKFKKEKNVAGSGGIMVVLGTMIGIFMYIAIQTFYFKSTNGNSINIFAILSSMFLVAGVGLVDDLFGWKKGGLSARSRSVLVLFSAVPLMVINAGVSSLMGIEFGILFPLIIIPLGILGATTAFNMVAGFNGLEASQGMIILSALALATYMTGNPWLSVVAFCMVAALGAFYLFNKNPAKIFPGDVLTYSVGILIASIAIMGNIEKIAIFFFIPYILEVILKIRSKINIKEKGFVQNFGVPNEDNSLELRYDKIYSITHLSLFILKKFKKKVYEQEVVYLINGFQLIIIILGFLFFL
jgi:UDP-N-acetylglucosamine--dolichyl-phosphate N-acetylglucosaminephosphotransferase